MTDKYPKGAPKPADDDMVMIVLPQWMARDFNDEFLAGYANKRKLAGPLLFGEDDSPTYIIQPD
jgi:hypothetical protein